MTTSITTHRINVALERNPYDVVIGDGVLGTVGEELRRIGAKPGRKILVVSNADVAGPYGEACINSLKVQGYNVEILVIDAGEDQKHLQTVSQIHDAAFAFKLERSSMMLALGGGVVGDMTGFAAATWLRGIGVTSTHNLVGDGGCLHRREDRGQSPRGQKSDRRFSSAESGFNRSQNLGYPSDPRISGWDG